MIEHLDFPYPKLEVFVQRSIQFLGNDDNFFEPVFRKSLFCHKCEESGSVTLLQNTDTVDIADFGFKNCWVPNDVTGIVSCNTQCFSSSSGI